LLPAEAGIFWRELGLDALRANRTLAVHPMPGGVYLEWSTRSSFAHLLQVSTDLVNWTTIQSNRGDGHYLVRSNAFPASVEFYRIQWLAE
jgi:hypothetical protein